MADKQIPRVSVKVSPALSVESPKAERLRQQQLQASLSATAAAAAVRTPTAASAADVVASEREAAAFLQKATLGGPTYAEIQALATGKSKSAWVASQFDKQFTKRLMDYAYIDQGVTNLTNFSVDVETNNAFATGLLQTDAPLRAKCLWALSKLFVISWPGGAFDDPGTPYSYISWFDRLNTHVFGNWRDLIESVTYSLHMSRMLSFFGNRKATDNRQPDENYAREIMQLFSIGLWMLNQDGTYKLDAQGNRIPTYGNDDIRQVARCMTGLTRWDFNRVNEIYFKQTANGDAKAVAQINTAAGHWLYGNPNINLVHYEPFYETGAKKALNGLIDIPEGTDPVTNLKMLHDALFNHPNTAPFFAIRMIQHLVTSNPSPEYVARVARAFDDNGSGVRGDMKAVWMAILTDPEAATDGRQVASFGRVRDGFDLWANMARSFDRKNSAGLRVLYGGGSTGGFTGPFGNTGPRMQPSIFSAYDPLHSPVELVDQGMLAPEMGMWSDVQLMNTLLALTTMLGQGEPNDTPSATTMISDYSMLPLAGTADDLVERLNLLMCGGRMADDTRKIIVDLIATSPVATTQNQYDRALVAMQLIINSTDFWVQV